MIALRLALDVARAVPWFSLPRPGNRLGVLLAHASNALAGGVREEALGALAVGGNLWRRRQFEPLLVRALQREQQPWDVWLEHLEHRFPTLRSWLRNALELESRPLAPGATSPELAAALRDEAARRLASVPLAQERPRVAPGPALLTLGGSAALILALALVWPQAAGRAWRTLWDPGAAAPPVTLHVEPGPVTLTPGATFSKLVGDAARAGS